MIPRPGCRRYVRAYEAKRLCEEEDKQNMQKRNHGRGRVRDDGETDQTEQSAEDIMWDARSRIQIAALDVTPSLRKSPA